MDFYPDFLRIMGSSSEIALSTAVGNLPNVRIISILWDKTEHGLIYFTTFRGSLKQPELQFNSHVAFTTLPINGFETVRVNKGFAKISGKKIAEIMDALCARHPGFDRLFAKTGGFMDLYELRFKEADISLDSERHGKVFLT